MKANKIGFRLSAETFGPDTEPTDVVEIYIDDNKLSDLITCNLPLWPSELYTSLMRKIRCVMAVVENKDSVFSSVDLSTSKHSNCFYHALYMIFDGGYLICSQYGSYWVDTAPIDETITDVSEYFSPIVGHEIRQVTFEHSEVIKGITYFGQPVTSFHFDNGIRLTFTTNFGEVEKSHTGSYYYFGNSEMPSENKVTE